MSDKLLTLFQHRLAALLPFMNDPEVQEIMIVGENKVFIERDGVITQLGIKIDNLAIEGAIKLLGKLNGKDVISGTREAIVNARIDGFRIAAALSSVSVSGSFIQIRKHNPVILSLEDYINAGQITPEGAQIIAHLVSSRKNVLVAGGTSSGKTTLVNCMIGLFDPNDVVRTVEDTQELKVKNTNWIAMEGNEQSGVTLRELVKLCLRLRPDRLLLGEIRGPEAYDLMQMANSGHDGIMGTLHSSSAEKTLPRFEDLILQSGAQFSTLGLKRSIASAFQAVIYCNRENGKRKIESIISIDGVDEQKMQYVTTKLYSTKE